MFRFSISIFLGCCEWRLLAITLGLKDMLLSAIALAFEVDAIIFSVSVSQSCESNRCQADRFFIGLNGFQFLPGVFPIGWTDEHRGTIHHSRLCAGVHNDISSSFQWTHRDANEMLCSFPFWSSFSFTRLDLLPNMCSEVLIALSVIFCWASLCISELASLVHKVLRCTSCASLAIWMMALMDQPTLRTST